MLPDRATLWCRPLTCHELWRRRNGRLGTVEGVDLADFNSFRPHKDAPSREALIFFLFLFSFFCSSSPLILLACLLAFNARHPKGCIFPRALTLSYFSF